MKTIDFKTRTEILNRAYPGKDQYWPIGLDIGYSAVKGMCPNKAFCYPAYAKKIPENRIVLKEFADTDIRYRDEHGTWAVGELAYEEASASETMDSETELFGRHRYYSQMFKVIARSGMALGLMGNEFGAPENRKILIQTGLPPKYEASDAAPLKEVLSGVHRFELKIGKQPWQKFEFVLAEEDIAIMPQPLGALVSASVDVNGKQLPIAKTYFNSNLIIFDPGFGTTDKYTVKRGHVVDFDTFPEFGMREVFARTCGEIRDVYGVELPITAMQKQLESGQVKVIDRKQMKSAKYSFERILENNSKKVCEDAIEKLKSIHDYFRDEDFIIATGGTYDAWAHTFNEAFVGMEDLQIIPGNINDTSLSNVFSNVRGYYFYLLNRLR